MKPTVISNGFTTTHLTQPCLLTKYVIGNVNLSCKKSDRGELSLWHVCSGWTLILLHRSLLQVLEMLQRFKDSTIKREREVFNCMLRNLFEEYRFFPQYPDKELHITACLFGGIIEKGLVTYMALGLALRYVLEALRKPYGSKMYYFGIAALDRFKNRYEKDLFFWKQLLIL